MPIKESGGVIHLTAPDRLFKQTGVAYDDEFAVMDRNNLVKQIAFDVVPTTPGPGTLTLRANISGDQTIDIGGTFAVGNSFGIVQPDLGTSPTATIVADTLTLTSSDSSVSITGNSTTNTIDFKAPSSSSITSLTGDGTATGPGASALTLATVNANTGSFGTASSSPTLTLNAKGLVTAASNTSIQIAESQVTSLVSDLAAKVPTSRLIGTTAPLAGGGDLSADRTLTIPKSTGSVDGYLAAADFTTFNAKQGAGNYITALTGDVSATGPGSSAATIANLAVTNAKIAANTIDLTAKVTGTLPIANGGTNSSTALSNGFVMASSGSKIVESVHQVDGSSKFLFGAAEVVKVSTLTDATTIATDASLGNMFTVVLAGNRTLGAPSNPTAGQKCVWALRQDSTGSRTLAYNAAFRFSTDIASPTLTTTANKTDYIGAIYNGTDSTWDVVAVVQGF